MTDVDTDDLRAWAAKADAVRADFGSGIVAKTSGLGAGWLDDAVDRFAEVWSTAVGRRLDDVDVFAENLRQTADVFDRGDDASRSELDQMIWSESDH